MAPFTRRSFLAVTLCVFGATGCSRILPQGYSPSEATIATLSQLGDLAKNAKSQQLRDTQSYPEFLSLFRSKQAPPGRDEMEHFQRDSWGSPFIFQREVLPNSVRLTITSPHLHYKTQRPISIEIDIPSDGG